MIIKMMCVRFIVVTWIVSRVVGLVIELLHVWVLRTNTERMSERECVSLRSTWTDINHPDGLHCFHGIGWLERSPVRNRCDSLLILNLLRLEWVLVRISWDNMYVNPSIRQIYLPPFLLTLQEGRRSVEETWLYLTWQSRVVEEVLRSTMSFEGGGNYMRVGLRFGSLTKWPHVLVKHREWWCLTK